MATNDARFRSKESEVNAEPALGDDGDVAQVHGRDYDPAHDQRDMRRLGKRQELKRRFRFFSIVGFVVVLGLTWEFAIVTSIFSLANGGTAGAIWLVLVVTTGLFCVMLSMAEMASMAPTTGGQYHWVSEFASPKYQKQLSYAVGWLGWHGALLTGAYVLSAILFNTSAIGKLPILEGLAVVLHIFGFFAFVVIFWVMGPRASAEETFTTFADDNGWGSVGLATLIGMVGPTTTYLGGDSAVHLAEELKDASYILPRAMFVAAIINYVLGFIMTVSFMFAIGDVNADLMDPSGQPWVAVVYRITGSRAATIVLILIMLTLPAEKMFMFFFCAVNQVTTSSRQVFAFARDKGFPFHKFLSKVNAKGVPSNSVYVTLAFTCILALIIIGSTTAFNIILSVTATGLFTSYLIVIGTVLIRKLRKQPFPASRFEVPRTLGICANIIAMCFLVVAFVFLFFPAAPNPNAAGMNWGILIYGSVIIIALLDYFFRGRHEYDVSDALVWAPGDRTGSSRYLLTLISPQGPVSYIRRELDYVEVK
ncbi:hypothetical protein B0A54_01557 [Friedmanniomyces endolithicus]|uniref:Amino acid permease/ SLC12A domain-containing protein n=1 Tax=Friedmanniomyces endolithicus TaxID=329885 RepID=A0A4U0VIC9_9PEZI|nr:hypothetical protein B0A54_01557 [Friedmanniomyces endolithicus]